MTISLRKKLGLKGHSIISMFVKREKERKKIKRCLVIVLLGIVMPLVSHAASYVKIVNQQTGKALEVANNGYNSLNSTSTPITQQNFAGTANQEWELIPVAGKPYTYRVQNRNNRLYWQLPRTSLGNPSIDVYQGEYDANNLNQEWRFVPQGSSFKILSNNNFQLALQVKNGSGAVGARLEQYYPSDPATSIQTWDVTTSTIDPGGDPGFNDAFRGSYKINPVYSPGRAIQVDAQSGSVGAYVVLGDMATASTQEWSLVRNGPGTAAGPYVLINRLSGLYLTIENQFNIKPGSYLQQGDYYGSSPAQRFYIRRVNSPNPPAYGDVGPYYIATTAAGGYVVQSSGPGYISGRLQIGQPIGQSNQIWNIVPQGEYRPGGTVLATNSSRKLDFSIYPNPVSNLLTISLSSAAKPQKVTVTDVRGAVSQSVRRISKDQLDTSMLAPGLYILTVTDGHYEYHQKFIKE